MSTKANRSATGGAGEARGASVGTLASRSRTLPKHDLLHVEDVAAFYGIGPAAMRKRIRLEQDCPCWHLLGSRWVVRKTTFLQWIDKLEGLTLRTGGAHG